MTPLDALYRCQRAWEATQPQLFFELWPDDGLGDTHTRPAVPPGVAGMEAESFMCVAEPVALEGSSHSSDDRDGLTSGAEPRREGTDGHSFPFASPSGLSPRGSGGSAPPINTTEGIK